MKNERRDFLAKALTLGATTLAFPSELLADDKSEPVTIDPKVRPKVLFFDVNETLLDLEPLKKSISKILGNQPELATLWFTTMLQYSLVVTVSGKYEDFGAIGVAALEMVARNNRISITADQAKAAVTPILSLKPHADVVVGLEALKKAGYKLVSFTNSSNKAVAAQLAFAEISHFFEEKLSVEDVRKFKPHTDAYYWAAKKLNVENHECMLVAAHGWDVGGAAWAGWRTTFLSRPGQQLFPLAPAPEINQPDLKKASDILCSLT